MTTKTLSPEAAKAKPKERWRAALRLTDQPIADAEGRITPDAELGNVLRALWSSGGEDTGPAWRNSYVLPAVRSVIDDLLVIQLACELKADLEASVLARILARLRHRLATAEWLDSIMEGAR